MVINVCFVRRTCTVELNMSLVRLQATRSFFREVYLFFFLINSTTLGKLELERMRFDTVTQVAIKRHYVLQDKMQGFYSVQKNTKRGKIPKRTSKPTARAEQREKNKQTPPEKQKKKPNSRSSKRIG